MACIKYRQVRLMLRSRPASTICRCGRAVVSSQACTNSRTDLMLHLDVIQLAALLRHHHCWGGVWSDPILHICVVNKLPSCRASVLACWAKSQATMQARQHATGHHVCTPLRHLPCLAAHCYVCVCPGCRSTRGPMSFLQLNTAFILCAVKCACGPRCRPPVALDDPTLLQQPLISPPSSACMSICMKLLYMPHAAGRPNAPRDSHPLQQPSDSHPAAD